MKTIKDIAKIANVSAGTVDRVLHNRGSVAKKTEIKIKKIIKETGFKPNLIARNLVLNTQYKVDVLIPRHDSLSPFWEFPKKGIHKAIDEVSNFGMDIVIHYFDQYNATSYEKKLDQLIANEPDGLIIAPHFTKETLKRKKALSNLNVPYVFLNTDLQGFNNVSFIGQDSFKSGYLAGKLFNSGKIPKSSSILIVDIVEDIENYYGLDSRTNGFIHYFDKNPSSLSIEKIRPPKCDRDLIHKYITKKLIENNTIKGIFLPSNQVYMIAEYLENIEINMNILIGYDITKKNKEYLNKGIISHLICQEPFNQGYQSIKLMFDYLIYKTDLKKTIFISNTNSDKRKPRLLFNPWHLDILPWYSFLYSPPTGLIGF